ncbi:hypothetical protein KC349_g154 [Hortaea werneckii]|nr:hypothetical protein KC349_g154 [Hortaea werneckii]
MIVDPGQNQPWPTKLTKSILQYQERDDLPLITMDWPLCYLFVSLIMRQTAFYMGQSSTVFQRPLPRAYKIKLTCICKALHEHLRSIANDRVFYDSRRLPIKWHSYL